MIPPLQTIPRDDPRYPARLRQRGTDAPPELTALGNLDLLSQPMTALFCSARCPGKLILRTYDQAAQWRDAGHCVVSGFHSPVEKECLRILLRGEPPIIICPARGHAETHPSGMEKASGRRPPADPLHLPPNRKPHHRRPRRPPQRTRRRPGRPGFVAHATPGGRLENSLRQKPLTLTLSMKFTVERKALVKMLQCVGKKHPTQTRRDKQVRLSACAARVFVEANQTTAGTEALVFEDGTCFLQQNIFLKVLRTYKSKPHVTIEADGRTLRFFSTTLPVTDYSPAVTPPGKFQTFSPIDIRALSGEAPPPTRTSPPTQSRSRQAPDSASPVPHRPGTFPISDEEMPFVQEADPPYPPALLPALSGAQGPGRPRTRPLRIGAAAFA